jgi:hypothetical protein
MRPELVALWIPRADEHALAASLGLAHPDAAKHRELQETGQRQAAADLPGVPCRIYRWHVWRVVRAMHRAGLTNTPEGRAAAFGILAGEPA